VHALLPDGVDSQQSVLNAYAHLKVSVSTQESTSRQVSASKVRKKAAHSQEVNK
jgi:hypothetical protein